MQLKPATFVDKIKHLTEFMPAIVADAKKDLKGDHLRSDPAFCKKYFAGKQRQKLGLEELVVAYTTEIVENANESLGEYVCNRWLIKNTDLYDHFAGFLQQINPEFDDIDSIDDEMAGKMLEGAEKEYGSLRSYLFAILNSVVFSEGVYSALSERAVAELNAAAKPVEVEEAKSIEALEKKLDRELRRMADKAEKRFRGLEKKYHQDTTALKKQVANLQRKLSEQAGSC